MRGPGPVVGGTPGAEGQVQLEGALLEDSAIFAGSVLVVMAFETVTSIIIARLLASDATYGMLALILSTLGLVGPFAVLSLPEGVTKLVAESRGSSSLRAREVIRTSVMILLLTSGTTALVLALGSGALATWLYTEPSLGILLAIASLAIVTSAIASLVLSIIRGLELVRWLGIVNAVNSAASIPLAFVLLPAFGLMGAVLVVVVNPLAIIGLGAVVVRRGLAGTDAADAVWDSRVAGRLLRFSSPLFLSTLLVVGVVWLLNTLLVFTGGFADAGQFRIGFNLYTIFLSLTSAIAVPLMPLVSRLESSRAGVSPTLLSDVFRLVLLTTLPITLAVAIFSRQLIFLLYGPQYESAWMATFAMMAAVLVASVVPSASAVIQGYGKTWQILKVDLMYAACIIGLSVIAIPRLGAWGAGLAYVVSYGVMAGVLLTYVRRLAHFEPLTVLGPFLLAAVSFSVGLLIVSTLTGPLLLAAGASCVLGTAGACWWLMNPRERRTLRRLLGRLRELPRLVPKF